ncbi:thiol-disulfide oxidoreductase DCC family protein [Roseovarius dicentrarchi]|uniref:thiol-disulfide oxidoreductase DCC family protein n=1 Tax=Roseovarius dicentrarchi TaxID=2250573 RepID=UPI000DE83DCB|nr:DUF393 domain-containing protein [Roseovarius dicentrarchi]
MTGCTTVYYDGACPLCRSEIGYYAKRDRDGRLDLVDVSQPGADLPDGLDANDAKARFHVQSAGGSLLSGAAAFAEVWRQVPGWGVAARVAHFPGVMPMLELAYRGFLRLRPGIVRLFVALRRRKAQ